MNVVRTFKAVAWSFFGVRKGSEYERDVAELRPRQVIVVGIACAALFVLALVFIVKWVVASGVAAG
ncbi:MAG TPA: DUF2970 domain-containing protein [Burkholderiaceae bacterium]|nr:DUF2970 domain-containing protein [Burkholderiaceae bacterium]